MVLDDPTIERLIREPKPSLELAHLMSAKRKRGHRETQVEVEGREGSRFRVIVRQLVLDPLDFSVILAYLPSGSTRAFRLRRHNGNSHEHSNKLERPTSDSTFTCTWRPSGIRSRVSRKRATQSRPTPTAIFRVPSRTCSRPRASNRRLRGAWRYDPTRPRLGTPPRSDGR